MAFDIRYSRSFLNQEHRLPPSVLSEFLRQLASLAEMAGLTPSFDALGLPRPGEDEVQWLRFDEYEISFRVNDRLQVVEVLGLKRVGREQRAG